MDQEMAERLLSNPHYKPSVKQLKKIKEFKEPTEIVFGRPTTHSTSIDSRREVLVKRERGTSQTTKGVKDEA